MKLKYLAALTVMPLRLTGCQSCDMMGSHFESAVGGLDRKIVAMTVTGDTLQVWRSRTVIEFDSAGPANFFDANGKRVTVWNCAIIAEEQ